MATDDIVLLERDGPVVTLTLNRPAVHNAFDEALIAALTGHFLELADDEGVRVVVLTGMGKSFSAGADLNWMKRAAAYDEEQNRADARALAIMLKCLDELPKPTIARVNGAALGGGVGLVAACDFAIAAETAVFATSEVRLGLVPGVISPFVIRAIGGRQARRYFMTAERFDAVTAKAIGLVHEVVATDQLDAAVTKVIGELLQGGPTAQGAAKQLVKLVQSMPQGGSLLTEGTVGAIAEARGSAEGKEGIGAFLEKRSAAWRQGR